MRNNIGLFGLLFMVMGSMPAADEPSRPRHFYVACSNQARYCAVTSPVDGIKVFEVAPKNTRIEAAYSVPEWSPQTFVSDDGRRLVLIGSAIVPDINFDRPIVATWINGKLFRQYLVRDLVDGSKLTKTTSGYSWFTNGGFDSDNQFAFQLNDNSTIYISFQAAE